MEENFIGKLLYSGLSCKGSLTDGKTYNCIAVSRGDVRIIDDEDEPFFHSATRPYHGKGIWLVIEDNSPNKLLSDFVKGKKHKTPEEERFDKDNVVAMSTIHFSPKDNLKSGKISYTENQYMKKTPEVKKRLNEIADDLASAFYYEIKQIIKENGVKLPISDDVAEMETEFIFRKGSSAYKVVLKEAAWEIYSIAKGNKAAAKNKTASITPIKTLPQEQFKTAVDLKGYLARSEEF